MSGITRKIGNYAIWTEKGGEKFFDKTEFMNYLCKMLQMEGEKRVVRIEEINLAIDIESFNENTKKNIEIVFKSCKYNHSPNYMSSKNGAERKSEKALIEGEKEITHMLIKTSSTEESQDEVDVAFEERRSGVSFANVIKYLNINLDKLQKNEKQKVVLKYAYIPSIDFLESLDGGQKMVGADLFVKRKKLGSEFLNLVDDIETVENYIVIYVKAKRDGNLIKEQINNKFRNAKTTKNRKIKRIRLYGKDDNIFLGTLDRYGTLDMLAGIKSERVNVELTNDGIVESSSLFEKMEEILEEKYEKQ